MFVVNENDFEYRFGDSGPKYLMKGPRMNFALVRFKPGEDFDAHYHNIMEENKMRSKMILQVHDELIFDTCPDELTELTEIVKEQMSGAMQLSVPLDVNINSGHNWFEAH